MYVVLLLRCSCGIYPKCTLIECNVVANTDVIASGCCNFAEKSSLEAMLGPTQ